MKKCSRTGLGHENSFENRGGVATLLQRVTLAVAGLLLLTAVTGCQTSPSGQPVGQALSQSESITLREGDTIKISFPGVSHLDTTQEIRRDGKITLTLGEVRAEGMTPSELGKEVARLYSSELVSKEVMVTVVSSSLPVFVTGAVIRPGKLQSNHPMTALEAVMEAGGFDYTKANTAAVKVIRHEGGQVKYYTLNLKLALQGKPSAPFYLKPSDIIFVPEKFTWF